MIAASEDSSTTAGTLDKKRGWYIIALVTEHQQPASAAETAGFRKEQPPEGESPVVKKLKQQTRAGASRTVRRRKEPEINEEEERLYRAALLYLIKHHGMFLVPTDVREVRVRGLPVWIFTVTLRYTTGHEGYLGDLLYDGETFTFLTEQAVMDERARKIAEDPEGLRKWNEYRDSTLRPGKA